MLLEQSHQVASLLPKLQEQFAEFLNKSSPARLRIFFPPTCVGLRYGHHRQLEIISWKHCAIPSVHREAPLGIYLALCQRIYLSTSLIDPRTLPIVRVFNVLRHPITIVLDGTGIFNLFPIVYAFLAST